MSNSKLEAYKNTFNKAWSFIKRDGADKLYEWIKNSDFFTAPASTRYHGAVEGGLLIHSVNVYIQLRKLYRDYLKKKMGMDLSPEKTPEIEEQIALVALTHDLCKCNFYEQKERYNGERYYGINDQLPLGHGEKSLYIVMQFVEVTIEEAMAIRWHMGAFDDAVKGGTYSFSEAQKKYPLVTLLHCADSLSAQLYED